MLIKEDSVSFKCVLLNVSVGTEMVVNLYHCAVLGFPLNQ